MDVAAGFKSRIGGTLVVQNEPPIIMTTIIYYYCYQWVGILFPQGKNLAVVRVPLCIVNS